MIGLSVWAAKNKKEFFDDDSLNVKLGWSWGLGVLAAILDLLALVPVAISNRRDD